MAKKHFLIPKPMPDEYPAYAAMYMRWLPDDGRILGHIKDQINRTREFVTGIPAGKWGYVYAPGHELHHLEIIKDKYL